MALCNSILTLEKGPDERNQPKVGYASSDEYKIWGKSSLTKRNQLFLGYVSGHCCLSRLRLEYDSVTKNRNQVFPSIGH
jgi:hypothetical protein